MRGQQKRGGGKSGNVKNVTVEILKRIRAELTGMRGELTGVRGEVVALRSDTNARFAELEQATVAGFKHLSARVDGLTERFDHFLGFAVERARDHERQIGRIERHVFTRRGA